MDQVADSLNEIMSSTMQDTTMADVVGATVNNNAVISTGSPVIAVAGDLPSFHYFISEQAKSMLALQELQNEVGALLEFRDLVMEAFPQLGQKMPQFQNASQTVMSPNKWEPGIRVKRKLGQQLRDQEMLDPSLVPRYRSNSQGKGSRSSEVSGSATSSSAIQDSGFCTESNKDHSSAISSRGKSREPDDELFSLLDTIHSRGTRLKREVEFLWNRLNCKSSSPLSTSKRRCKSLDDLILKNNNTNRTVNVDCSLNSDFLDTQLSDLKHERDLLLKKLGEIESEHIANLAQTNRLLAELETVSAEKRDLEERLQMAISSESEINNRINDLHHNYLARNQLRNAQTPFAKCQLLKLMQFFKENQQAAEDPPDKASNQTQPFANDSAASFSQKIDRPSNPLTKELSSSVYQVDGGKLDLREEFDKKKRRSKGDGDGQANDSASAIDQCISSIGKPDILIGFLSGHSSFLELPKDGSISLSKEKVLSILNEFNPIELQRYLLTLSYQIEALNVHVQRIAKSRMNIFQQLNRYKIENEDLKFQLEEKNIQLEGTKAKVRVLEHLRNEKLSYSTSDLGKSTVRTAGAAESNHDFTCPVSDTALHTQKTVTTLSCARYSEKCTDLRDHSDNIHRTKPSASSSLSSNTSTSARRMSKIPLKTNSTSKLPTKLNCSYKKFTSFKDCKEYSAPGPPACSSCVSSTSSSLNAK